jgi:hypothetical protein
MSTATTLALRLASLLPLLVFGDVGTAFQALANEMVTWAPGIVAFALVTEGVLLATALDDPQKQTSIKRAIGATVMGGLLIIVGSELAKTMLAAFAK